MAADFGQTLCRVEIYASSIDFAMASRSAKAALVRIRPASTEEAIVLRQLPTPGGAPPSTATVLVADVNGAAAAALSLDAGLIMSATDAPARELKELLLMRARQLLCAGARREARVQPGRRGMRPHKSRPRARRPL
jgi:hypothetical protein